MVENKNKKTEWRPFNGFFFFRFLRSLSDFFPVYSFWTIFTLLQLRLRWKFVTPVHIINCVLYAPC